MTFKVGDKGQRYEVRCTNEVGIQIIVGWAETIEEKISLVEGVLLHPSFHSPRVIDRKAQKEVNE